MEVKSLSVVEIRILIANLGGKLQSWMHDTDVCDNKMVRETTQRMAELANNLPITHR